MKIRMVFEPDHDVLVGGSPRLYLLHVINPETHMPIADDLYGVWVADGEVEAVDMDVLPPLDKVTLTVAEPGPNGDRTEMTYLTPDELETLRALRAGRAVVYAVQISK